MSIIEASIRGRVLAADCPSREILRHGTSRWGMLVLMALGTGSQRFAGLRREVEGISERMLAQTLRELEMDGMVWRRAHPVVPPHVDYGLTDLGLELMTRLRSVGDWVEENLPRILAARAAHSAGEAVEGKAPAP